MSTPWKRRTPAELEAARAVDRTWRLKAWLMTMLPKAEFLRLLHSPMPPSIEELYEMAREHTAQHAGKCPHCGERIHG